MASCAAWTSACPATATWHSEHSGTTRTLYDAGCLTASRCFAVGDAGTLLATTNGGRSWHHETIPTKAPLYRIACAGPASCYVIARPSTVWVTHDAGAHWAARVLPVHVSGLAQPGCVVGDASNPQGEVPCRLGLLDIACPSARTCYAAATLPGGWDTTPISQPGGDGPGSSLWLTRNGGATWTRQAIPSGVVLRRGLQRQRARTATPWNGSPARPPGRAWPAATSSSAATRGSPAALAVTPAPGGTGGWNRAARLGGCAEPVTDVGACPASNRCYAVNNSSPFGDGSTVTRYTATGKNGAGATVPTGLVIEDIACPAARTCYTAGPRAPSSAPPTAPSSRRSRRPPGRTCTASPASPPPPATPSAPPAPSRPSARGSAQRHRQASLSASPCASSAGRRRAPGRPGRSRSGGNRSCAPGCRPARRAGRGRPPGGARPGGQAGRPGIARDGGHPLDHPFALLS